MDYFEKTVGYIQEKTSHPGVKKHTKNMGWMFFAKIASMVISLITMLYVARHLGPTNYGQLSYAISFVGLFSFVAALGIDQVLYRDLVRFPEKRNEYLGSAIGLRFVASLLTIGLCLLFAVLLSDKDVSLFLIFIISLGFVFNSFNLISYEFQANVQQKYPYLLVLGVTIILNILKITTTILDKGVIFLACIVLLEAVLYMLGYLYIRTKFYGTVRRLKFDKVIALGIIKDSFPLIFASAFVTIYARIDQVMIKNMMDATSVGLYSSAVSISEIWYVIPAIVTSSLFPAIVNAKKVSEQLYYARIKKLYLLVFAISAGTALITSLFSKDFILLIFGSSFIGAYTVLQVYVWSNVGGILNSLSHQILVSENMTKIISITSFLGMITNIILNYFFIPIFGMVGAAFASLISYFIPLGALFLFKKSRKVMLNTIRGGL